jgi:hypothetical protein
MQARSALFCCALSILRSISPTSAARTVSVDAAVELRRPVTIHFAHTATLLPSGKMLKAGLARIGLIELLALRSLLHRRYQMVTRTSYTLAQLFPIRNSGERSLALLLSEV